MNDLLLPPASRLIHIGPHKTGSTAIQVSMHKARAALAEHGVRYGGKARRSRRAGWAIGLPGDWQVKPPIEEWDRLVADVQSAGDDRVCISNEDFGRGAKPDQIRRIVDDLGGGNPHIVLVARRLDKYLPSQWQESVKAGKRQSYEAWLRVIMDRYGEEYSWDRSSPSFRYDRTNVWYSHDTAALVRRWADVVGPERITVIVSDDTDRELLPRTFEQMLGLPAGLLELFPDRSNRGLVWSEVEFVRAIHELLAVRQVPADVRRRLVSRGIVKELQSRPAADAGPSKPPFPAWAAEMVREISAKRVEEVRGLGARVVGDPAALAVPDLEAGDPSDIPGLPAVAAARAVDWLVAELDEQPEPAAPGGGHAGAEDYEPIPGRGIADRIPHAVRAKVPATVRRGIRRLLRRPR